MAPILSRVSSGFGFGKRTAAAAAAFATGGNVVPSAVTGNGYTYHVFTTSGAFDVSSSTTRNIEYLVIGGGGAGGVSGGSGGGGGAGGFRTNVPGHPYAGSALPLGAGSYPVSIGSGGESTGPGTFPPLASNIKNPGTATTFHTITSEGGGGGARETEDGGSAGYARGGSGGSGGGGSGGSSYNGQGGEGNRVAAIPYNGGSPVPTQGNNGGTGSATHKCYAGAGGGGAGGTGSSSSPGTPAPGGAGSPIPAFAYPIIQSGIPSPMQPTFGPAVGPTGLYAGGGGGGVYNWDPRDGGFNCFPGGGAPGGSGGGGTGGQGTNYSPSPQPFVKGTDAVNGTGSGGGGSGGVGPAGSGGSGGGGNGIVIIRYLT